MTFQSRGRIILGTALLATAVIGIVLFGRNRSDGQVNSSRFDGERAYSALKKICALGPRPSGSPAMEEQRRLLADHFGRLGARVITQSWEDRHPVDGSAVPMVNLIIEWHPDRHERVLVCAHYDTRPYPDQDAKRPKGTFIGANDGGSGTAVLYELGHHMANLRGECGVDFVLFDCEEFLFDDRRDRERYFLGATQFAKDYVARNRDCHYRCGVLLDMVGDADLQIYHERNSLKFARNVVNDIWRVAAANGIDEFKPRLRHEINDDHIPLNEIAHIPTCDIIDFDYPRPGFGGSYWHTEKDVPENCSAASLRKVGTVLLAWLQAEVAKPVKR